MAGPDLTYARARAAELMVDTLRITKDPEGPNDAAMDPDTLEIVGPGSPERDPQLVYEGPGRVHPPRRVGSVEREGGATYYSSGYPLSIPFDAPCPRPGDLVEVVAVHSAGEVELEGQVFVLVDVSYKTYAVTRQLLGELRA